MTSTSGSSTSYLYNALGQMIEKSGTLGTTIFVQDESGHLIGEYDGSGNLIEETVWLGDIPVATLRPNGSSVNIYYVHTDHLNTPRKVSQPSSGTLAWRWDADPFGTTADNQNPGGLGTFVYNIRLPGQYYQAETGLNYNYNRDYDPTTGRYVESDPVGLYGGLSTYAYAGDAPPIFIDPFGTNPGDSFPSPEAAAIDAIRYINPKSTCTKEEFGGWVYKQWSLFGGTSYTYDEPSDLGGAKGGTMPPIPWFHAVAAMFHTHGGFDPNYDSENYSPEDEDAADGLGIPSYIGTPGLLIKRYSPIPRRPRQGSIATVGTTCGCSK
jgi:RHS repeat-associated protein